jgi:transcriptional regulator with XRE-family HTH domain
MDKNNFGRIFKSERIRKGLKTQASFIRDYYEKTGVKLQKSAVSMYENGKRIPERETLDKFADYFKVSLDYLHGRSTTRLEIVYKILDNYSALFNQLSDEDKKSAMNYMEFLHISKNREDNNEKT